MPDAQALHAQAKGPTCAAPATVSGRAHEALRLLSIATGFAMQPGKAAKAVSTSPDTGQPGARASRAVYRATTVGEGSKGSIMQAPLHSFLPTARAASLAAWRGGAVWQRLVAGAPFYAPFSVLFYATILRSHFSSKRSFSNRRKQAAVADGWTHASARQGRLHGQNGFSQSA